MISPSGQWASPDPSSSSRRKVNCRKVLNVGRANRHPVWVTTLRPPSPTSGPPSQEAVLPPAARPIPPATYLSGSTNRRSSTATSQSRKQGPVIHWGGLPRSLRPTGLSSRGPGRVPRPLSPRTVSVRPGSATRASSPGRRPIERSAHSAVQLLDMPHLCLQCHRNSLPGAPARLLILCHCDRSGPGPPRSGDASQPPGPRRRSIEHSTHSAPGSWTRRTSASSAVG
ncbi:hypothetical protein NDU88_003245 [Pleurodeles waltl]|uniref:Uncharacterized protein n=1 Tax=Pleurodeles waltl TaxID=8319 RepID=A0AAV7LIA9_PLEWA|nr:hypothetical protein NDU88_003245 [Pleurodeles waltl]